MVRLKYRFVTAVYLIMIFKFDSNPPHVSFNCCRYIAVRLNPHKLDDKSVPNERHLADNLLDNVQRYYGDFGAGSIKESFKVKYVNQGTKTVIIRVRHGPHRFLVSILPLIVNPHRYQLVNTAATLKNCMQAVVADHNQALRLCLRDEPNSQKRIQLREMYTQFIGGYQ